MADISKTLPLQKASVKSAHELIKPHIHLTPVLTSTTLSALASAPQSAEALIGTPYEGRTPAHPTIKIFFKCENLQRVGAFKARGAFHALMRLSDEERSKGVVTTSSGMIAILIFCPPIYTFYGKLIILAPELQEIMHKPLLWPQEHSACGPTSSCQAFLPHQKSKQRKDMEQRSFSAEAQPRRGTRLQTK